MDQDSPSRIKASLGQGKIASRATNVVLAATLAASMVPTAAFAAFNDEVNVKAGDEAGQVAAQSADGAGVAGEPVAQSADEGASESVTDAYGDVVADGDAASLGLDHANLPDGQYTVKLMMMNINGRQVSMSNGAVGNVVDGTTGQHLMTLDVENGEYWLTMRWVPLERNLGGTPFVGYLANLAYFEDYSFTPYLQGTKVAAKVLSQYVNEDGTPVYDDYNRPGSDSFVGDNIYPKDVQIKISGASLEDGMQPVHVFVPVMDAIMTGAGDQNAYVKLFWNSLSVNYLTTDKTTLKTSLDAANALEQGKKSDDAWNALKSAIETAQGVYDNAKSTQEKVTDAATKLDAAVKDFQDSPDASADTDPFDGQLEQGQRYKTAQMLYTADGSEFKGTDDEVNVLNGFWTSFEYSGSADGKYAVTIEDPYNTADLAKNPVADSIEYVAPDGSTKRAKKACDRQKGAENSRQSEWLVFADNLNKKIQLNISYTLNGQKKVQTVYLQPVKEGATLVTSMLSALTGNGFMTSRDTNYSPLYQSILDAKAVEQGKKSDEAWETLQKAISDAQAILDSNNKKQPTVDLAAETLNAAVEIFNKTPDEVADITYGLAKGVFYQHTRMDDKALDASGASVKIDGPFSLGKFKYRLTDDGKFEITTASPEISDGEGVSITDMKIGVNSNEAAAVATEKVSGYTGIAKYRVTLDSIADGFYVWLSYTDAKGVAHDSERFYITNDLTDRSGDFGFVQSYIQQDCKDLYDSIESAKQIAQDNKTDEAYGVLQTAISSAVDVLGKDKPSQGEYTTAQTALNDAVKAFNESADKVAQNNIFNFAEGTWYWSYPYPFVTGGDAAGIYSNKSMHKVKYQNGQFDLELFLNIGAKVESVKASNVDDVSTAVEGFSSAAYSMYYRVKADELTKVYLWLTYTDENTGQRVVDKRVVMDFTSLTANKWSVCEFAAPNDKGYLYKAIADANAITYADKGEQAWTDLRAAIDTANKFYKSVTRNTAQVDIDAATEALESAIAAY